MGKAQGACAEGMLMLREAVRGRYDLDLVPNLDRDSDPRFIDPRLCSLAPAQLLNLKN